jgi:hypothetical protein
MERLNVVISMSEKSELAPYQVPYFSLGKESYIEFCTKKERSGIAWLSFGVSQFRGMKSMVLIVNSCYF